MAVCAAERCCRASYTQCSERSVGCSHAQAIRRQAGWDIQVNRETSHLDLVHLNHSNEGGR